MFQGSKIKYNSLSKDKEIESFLDSDLSLWFKTDIEVMGDLLIRMKHFHSNKIRIPVLRTMIHTGFVFDNVVRLYKKDIDFSGSTSVPEDFFIDFFFTFTEEETFNDPNSHPFDELEELCR